MQFRKKSGTMIFRRKILFFVSGIILMVIFFVNNDSLMILTKKIEKETLSNQVQLSEQFISDDISNGNIVLTIFGTTKPDPQRNYKIDPTFEYMRNFYISAKWLNITVIIFYDNLTQTFRRKYTTQNINFQKITMDKQLSINDYRFIVYHNWLKMQVYKNILFVDIADVFFWRNPFHYMKNKVNHDLFISSDIGTFKSNPWMKRNFKKCYGNKFNDLDHPTYSPGVWGGAAASVHCLLGCTVEQIKQTNKKAHNCNMIAFNWCIINSNCTDNGVLDTNLTFTNPYREKCEEKFTIIHDKCTTSAHRCLYLVNNTLIREYCSTKHGYYNK